MIVPISNFSDEELTALKTVVDEEIKRRDDATFQYLAQEVVDAWNRLKKYDKYATFGFYDRKCDEKLAYPNSIHSKGRAYKIK